MKLHIEQAQRSKKIMIRREITERVAVTKGKGQNSFTKRMTGECFQWKANGSCSQGDSCSFQHTRASGNRETTSEEVENARVSGLKTAVYNEQRRKGKEEVSSSVQTGKRTDRRETLDDLRLELKPLVYGGARCKRSSCAFRHPPVCRGYKSGNRCIYGNKCLYRQADGEEKRSKKSRKESTQGEVAILKEKKRSKVVYLKNQIQRSLFCGKLGKRD